MKYSLTDIPYDLAYQAHSGTSFSPEERAKQEQRAYVQHMSQMVEEYSHLPGANSELERYREGFIKHYCAWLSAKSRVMSPMITGPAKFPTARNDKNLEIEHKRLTEYIEWKERAIERLERNLGLRDSGIISSDDPEAVQKLEEKLAALTNTHEAMKAANKQARAEGKPAPHPSWQLSNNSANMRRIKQRIANLQAKAQDVTTEIPFTGGVIVEANRVQIVFDNKPDVEVRNQLKASGFRWAPSQSAWQRHRGVNAMSAAKRIVGVE